MNELDVLQIQHHAVIKQDVYQWVYELCGENTKTAFERVVVDGLYTVDIDHDFLKHRHFPIVKRYSEEFKTETIINCKVNIAPLKKGEEFYNPITGLVNTVESCLRGLDGKYYYKVKSRVDEPIGSKEKLEELKKEQQKLINEYLMKQKQKEQETSQVIVVENKTPSKWSLFK